MRHPHRLLALALSASCLLGCFRDPVDETIDLCFDAEGRVTVSLDVQLRGGDGAESALAARLEETRSALEDGYSDWHTRFERLARPLRDASSFERADGRLERYRRSALVRGADRALRDFFADVPLAVYYSPAPRGQAAELVFVPTAGDRATTSQRQEVERRLTELSSAVARHYRASDAIFRYLRSSPDRAHALLGELLADVLAAETQVDPELMEEEERLLAVSRTAEDEVLQIFDTGPGEAFTLQELSRKVFDPFPARVRVRVPGAVTEVTGLGRDDRGGGEGALVVERLSFWDALAALDGTFLEPDLLVAKVQALKDDEKIDLDRLLRSASFRSRSPSAPEVRDAIVARLQPLPEYRVTWLPAAANGIGAQDPARELCPLDAAF